MKKYAIYFPQFHEIPENNINFYPGYTDIVNLNLLNIDNKETPSHKEFNIDSITKYDYVVNEDLIKTQINLLKKYNIDGFATYHYWFSDNNITNKKTIMENINIKLLNSDLSDKKIFYIWANENWTNNYHLGDSKHIIMNKYTDIEEHCNYLMKIFTHDNYLKLDNKPLFLIHHPWLMKNSLVKYEKNLSKLCKNYGYNGILIVKSSFKTNKLNVLKNKDKFYDHHPHYKKQDSWAYKKDGEDYNFLNYDTYVNKMENIADIQTIFFDFDNRARLYNSKNNRKATICTHNTEKAYIKYINKIKQNLPKILLINAWNEWGEKMHIEPSNEKHTYYLDLLDKYFGLKYTDYEIIDKLYDKLFNMSYILLPDQNTLLGTGRWQKISKHGKIIKKVISLDKSYNEPISEIFQPDCVSDTFVGEIKKYIFDNQLYFITHFFGSRKNLDIFPENVSSESLKLYFKSHYKNYLWNVTTNRVIPLHSDIPFGIGDTHKNFLLFKQNNTFYVITNVVPHKIFILDINTGYMKEIISEYNDGFSHLNFNIDHICLSGGPIHIQDKNMYLVSCHVSKGGFGGYRMTFFYTFDDKFPFKIINVSPLINFNLSSHLEYCNDIFKYKNDIFLSLGINDKYSILIKTEINKLLNLVR